MKIENIQQKPVVCENYDRKLKMVVGDYKCLKYYVLSKKDYIILYCTEACSKQ